MPLKITFTPRFKKHFRSFSEKEKQQITKKLKVLAENPMHPSLRAKHIQGAKSLFECSINMDIRAIWCYEGKELIIILDIGHHDILRKY